MGKNLLLIWQEFENYKNDSIPNLIVKLWNSVT